MTIIRSTCSLYTGLGGLAFQSFRRSTSNLGWQALDKRRGPNSTKRASTSESQQPRWRTLTKFLGDVSHGDDGVKRSSRYRTALVIACSRNRASPAFDVPGCGPLV